MGSRKPDDTKRQVTLRGRGLCIHSSSQGLHPFPQHQKSFDVSGTMRPSEAVIRTKGQCSPIRADIIGPSRHSTEGLDTGRGE